MLQFGKKCFVPFMSQCCFSINLHSVTYSWFDPGFLHLLRIQRGIDFLTFLHGGYTSRIRMWSTVHMEGNVLTFTCANTGNASWRKISFAFVILSGNLQQLFTLAGLLHSKLRFRVVAFAICSWWSTEAALLFSEPVCKIWIKPFFMSHGRGIPPNIQESNSQDLCKLMWVLAAS